MKGRLHCQCYAFDETFKPHNAEKFVLAFFNDKNIRCTLETEVLLPDVVESVEVTPVTCSLLTLDIFSRLTGPVTRENGIIKSCLDEIFESILISDELRKILLLEDSENYSLFTEQERDEFLFRLFKHICIGGELCQFENEINPYLDFVRSLYRDLVRFIAYLNFTCKSSVQKDQATKDLHVVSYVYSVIIKVCQNTMLYAAFHTLLSVFTLKNLKC
ncbi:unnamed protein product [Dibothriocephalus latus]|uniref:Cilia- and flagella-associated protein 300 n=1 Tax=Dibothriocephalus latus TaxID=60516 RepID=A0A3P7PXN0_DIBLA|nr:unnamed protein product [Dibothriocephalus latus]